MKNRIYDIKTYPNNLVIFSVRNDKYKIFELDIEGCVGLYTRQEWIDADLSIFNSEEQEQILKEMERTSNLDFFDECSLNEEE